MRLAALTRSQAADDGKSGIIFVRAFLRFQKHRVCSLCRISCASRSGRFLRFLRSSSNLSAPLLSLDFDFLTSFELKNCV